MKELKEKFPYFKNLKANLGNANNEKLVEENNNI